MGNFDYLKKVPYFNELEDKSLEEIHKILIIKSFKKALLFSWREKGEAIYFVKSGKVKISKPLLSGKNTLLKSWKKGTYLLNLFYLSVENILQLQRL